MRLQFDRFRGFVEEYSANLSLGGMFIRTDEALELGAEMPIEFRLGEDYELIRGRGRVVWVRDEELDHEHPAGMGIRFLELTPGSRELIFKLVERRVRDGGDPFDLEAEAELLDDLPRRPPEPGPAPEALVGVALAKAEPLPFWREDDSASRGEAGEAEKPVLVEGRNGDEEEDEEEEEFDPWADLSSPEDGSPARGAEDAGSEGAAVEPSPLADPPPTEESPSPVVADPGNPPVAESATAGFTESGGHTPVVPDPVAAGAAFDRSKEDRVLRRRQVLFFGLPLFLVAVLVLGWWLLGGPPTVETGSQATVADAAPAPPNPEGTSTAAGGGEVTASEVVGGLDGIRATPPGLEGATASQETNSGARFEGEVPTAEPVALPSTAVPATPNRDGFAAAPTGAAAGVGAPAADTIPLRVERITHRAEGSRTILEVTTSRTPRSGDYAHSYIGGLSPRHLVRFLGVDSPLPAGQVVVDTDQVARVRSGLHLDREPRELHLVFDLNSPQVRVTSITPTENGLRLVVEGAR